MPGKGLVGQRHPRGVQQVGAGGVGVDERAANVCLGDPTQPGLVTYIDIADAEGFSSYLSVAAKLGASFAEPSGRGKPGSSTDFTTSIHYGGPSSRPTAVSAGIGDVARLDGFRRHIAEVDVVERVGDGRPSHFVGGPSHHDAIRVANLAAAGSVAPAGVTAGSPSVIRLLFFSKVAAEVVIGHELLRHAEGCDSPSRTSSSSIASMA